MLQQYLPFTVLKLAKKYDRYGDFKKLQQYLPFTVLKHLKPYDYLLFQVATVLTVYGIETY